MSAELGLDATIRITSQDIPDFEVSLNLDTTVGELKEMIEAISPDNPPVDRQRLIFRGRQLADDLTIRDAIGAIDLSAPVIFHLAARPLDNTPPAPRNRLVGLMRAPFANAFRRGSSSRNSISAPVSVDQSFGVDGSAETAAVRPSPQSQGGPSMGQGSSTQAPPNWPPNLYNQAQPQYGAMPYMDSIPPYSDITITTDYVQTPQGLVAQQLWLETRLPQGGSRLDRVIPENSGRVGPRRSTRPTSDSFQRTPVFPQVQQSGAPAGEVPFRSSSLPNIGHSRENANLSSGFVNTNGLMTRTPTIGNTMNAGHLHIPRGSGASGATASGSAPRPPTVSPPGTPYSRLSPRGIGVQSPAPSPRGQASGQAPQTPAQGPQTPAQSTQAGPARNTGHFRLLAERSRAAPRPSRLAEALSQRSDRPITPSPSGHYLLVSPDGPFGLVYSTDRLPTAPIPVSLEPVGQIPILQQPLPGLQMPDPQIPGQQIPVPQMPNQFQMPGQPNLMPAPQAMQDRIRGNQVPGFWEIMAWLAGVNNAAQPLDADAVHRQIRERAGHFWLAVRLSMAVVLFSAGAEWSRIALIWATALAIFAWQTGMFNDHFGHIANIFNGLFPDPNAPAPPPPPPPQPEQAAQPNNNAQAGPQNAGGAPDPQDLANRLIQRNDERLAQNARDMSHGIRRALWVFVASFIPGLGERFGEAAAAANRERERLLQEQNANNGENANGENTGNADNEQNEAAAADTAQQSQDAQDAQPQQPLQQAEPAAA